MARFDPVAHVAEDGAISCKLVDREAVRQALLPLAKHPWRDQVAVITTVKTKQRRGVMLFQVVMHRNGRGQPGAPALRRLSYAGQADPAWMGGALGAVGVH